MPREFATFAPAALADIAPLVDPPPAGAVIPLLPEWSMITLRKSGGTGPPGRYAGIRPIVPTSVVARFPFTGVGGGVGSL